MRCKASLTVLLLSGMPLANLVTGLSVSACKSVVAPTQSIRIAEAKIDSVAERMLLYQRINGGWPQPGGNAINYNRELTADQKKKLLADKDKLDTTIDDKATTREINYLVEAFGKTRNDAYLTAAQQGIVYLLAAQNAKGGWGQFFPDSSSYRKQITYNDNAMIDVMWVMKRTAAKAGAFGQLDRSLVPKAQQAVERGVECILNTQYIQNGKRTAWCAQHDRVTLQPTNARAFELASLSGSESVGIIEFLMQLDKPSDRVKEAIQSGVAWLDSVKLLGINTKTIADPKQKSGKDVVVVQDPNSVKWARFYELGTNRPFFCGRDGVKRFSLDQIENERRVGYGWYGTWPAKLIASDYPAWQAKWVR
ncbi:pectate lyase [Fibrella arboris]|uniref:pectate lyase n=1 Tax=Fibrella arboris TaxID=3242486 RepID=UPI0035225E54